MKKKPHEKTNQIQNEFNGRKKGGAVKSYHLGRILSHNQMRPM